MAAATNRMVSFLSCSLDHPVVQPLGHTSVQRSGKNAVSYVLSAPLTRRKDHAMEGPSRLNHRPGTGERHQTVNAWSGVEQVSAAMVIIFPLDGGC